MQIVAADSTRLDEVRPLFLAMHEHHRAVAPQAAAVREFRSDEEAWARRREHYRKLLASGGGGHLLIAERDGRAIGYAVVAEVGGQATLRTRDRMAELESLSVLPEERGAGVGRALVEAAYDVIRGLGLTEVMLYVMDGNADALRFYAKLGLRPYLGVLLGEVTDP